MEISWPSVLVGVAVTGVLVLAYRVYVIPYLKKRAEGK